MKSPGIQIILFLFFVILFLSGSRVQAQQKQKYTVAIFVYQGVELLDFAGPGEAFAATPDFTVYTVSVDGKDILSQGFLTVKPQYSIDNAPAPDIIVFPGGNIRATSTDPKVIGWIKDLVSEGTTAMSVCNGAGILARTGLLNGLNVTTHNGFIQTLGLLVPSSKVLEDTRWVDNGNIITTAGVSAGIDGALHVIARIKGIEVAESVAVYMEYNKWMPEQGRVDYKNDWLEKMQGQSNGSSTGNKALNKEAAINTQIPYEGELKNLGMDLLNKGMYSEAARAMEQAIKWYPYSSKCFSILSKAYLKIGRAAPMDEDGFSRIIDSGKIDEAVSVYEKTQQDFPNWQLFSEGDLNTVGYRLLQKEDYVNAIKIFSLNTKAFPQSWNVWDSFAEAHMKAGNKIKAIEYYRKSLDLNPKNDNARKFLAQLGG